MAKRKANPYREANEVDAEARPIDDELERRLRHASLRKRIIAAQGRVVAALGERRDEYLMLEDLVVRRGAEREKAMFDIGFEHGLVRGRADALSAMIQPRSARGRALAKQIVRLAANVGLEGPGTLAALLEVAWALALGPRTLPRRTPGE